jgi:hypothetical protein
MMDKVEYISELLREARKVADTDAGMAALAYLIQMAIDEAGEIDNHRRNSETQKRPD